MNSSGVYQSLAASTGIIGLSAMFCALLAHQNEEAEVARGLLLSGFMGTFLSLFWLLLVRDAARKSGPREALLFLVGFWTLAPIIAAPAFWSAGVVDGWMAAIFEAVSNLTTTGSSLGDSRQPDAIRLWRACLQFIGGVSSVVMAVVIFAALNSTGPGVHRSHMLTHHRDNIFSRYGRVALTITVIYGGATLIAVFAIVFGGGEALDAITRSVAAVTTSNTLADEGDLAVYTGISPYILCALLFLGSTNIAIYADIRRSGGLQRYLFNAEAVTLLGLTIVVASLVMWFRGTIDLRLFAEGLAFLSTSGMSVTGINGLQERLPQPVPELLAFIGASTLSTAGGLKLARVFILWSRAQIEFRRMAFANSIAPLKVDGRARRDAVIIGVWVYLVGYIGSTVLIGLGLTFADLDFDLAFRTSIGAISNHGALVDYAVVDQAPNNLALFLITLGCVLGRMEVLLIAPLFTLEFWRR